MCGRVYVFRICLTKNEHQWRLSTMIDPQDETRRDVIMWDKLRHITNTLHQSYMIDWLASIQYRAPDSSVQLRIKSLISYYDGAEQCGKSFVSKVMVGVVSWQGDRLVEDAFKWVLHYPVSKINGVARCSWFVFALLIWPCFNVCFGVFFAELVMLSIFGWQLYNGNQCLLLASKNELASAKLQLPK